jgi:hypothetical protein
LVKSNATMRAASFALLALSLLGLGSLAYAQAPTGVITGTVTDQTGAVIPNATVTITDKASNTNRAATANGAGLYSAAALCLPAIIRSKAKPQASKLSSAMPR